MLLSAAVSVALGHVAFHGGTTTGGTSTGAATSGPSTGTTSTTSGTGTTGAASTGATTIADDTTDTLDATDTVGTSETLGDSASATATATEGDAPASSSDAGADPTFGSFDESSSAGLDDDLVDGCCDHRENNSDNFLCRISSTRFDRLAITVVLLLLGRPRQRGRTAGAS
jgi:hypothetical protein